MEYNGMCLFGFGRWRADGIIGKSGAWPKIFGWKLGVSRKIFGLKLEKSGISLGLKDWGRPSAVRLPVILRHFYIIRIDYGVRLCDISYSQCQIIPFPTDIL